MEVLQVGSLAILLKWVLLAAAVVIGLLFIRYWLMRTQDTKFGKQVFDLLVNSLFVGFFAWKGSLLLLEPGLVLKSPLSLLYFTGGRNGLVIAIICAIIYFLIKAGNAGINKQLMVQTVFIYSSTALGMYHLLFAIFLPEDIVFHLLIGIGALLASLFQKKLQIKNKMLLFVMLFSFGYEILSLALLHSENKIFLFTSDQWFFFIVILVSLYYLEKGERKKEEKKGE